MVEAEIPYGHSTSGRKTVKQNVEVQYPGMSLRDYFAGQALAGTIAGLNRQQPLEPEEEVTLARSSYSVADAMLAARNK